MDLDDGPEEAEYRAKVRAWLKENAPPRAKSIRQKMTPEVMAAAKAWQARKADAGFAGIRRPKEWGGGGGTILQEIIFNQEEEELGLAFNLFGVGLGMALPTILEHGDEAIKKELVGPSLRGDILWVQLFSEPAAGSDLAALRMTAVKADDGSGDWILNGQKVWNSYAQVADWGICMARTDPSLPKNKGLTYFLIDMKTPGVTVKPIHQISGAYDFNEVFFDDVRVPDSYRLGPVNGGWKVVMTTLTNERFTTLTQTRRPNWEEILKLAQETPAADGMASDDPAFRDKLADWYARAQAIRMLRFRILTSLSRGDHPGSEASLGKVVVAQQLNEISTAGTELANEYGILHDEELSPQGGVFQQMFLYSPAARLGGGSDEINKNVLAERVLGLPGDIRVDKGPFQP